MLENGYAHVDRADAHCELRDRQIAKLKSELKRLKGVVDTQQRLVNFRTSYLETERAEVKRLKERIAFAVDYLPSCPDKAKSILKGNPS